MRPGWPLPDCAVVYRELRRKGVTLQLPWLEYATPTAYQYTQFVQLYRRWEQRIEVITRQRHYVGEKCFVDWTGQTLHIVDPATGQHCLAPPGSQLFA